MERKWFQGMSIVNLLAYLLALAGISIFLVLFVRFEVPLEIVYITLLLLALVFLFFIRFLMIIRPAKLEIHRDRVRLYHGPSVAREIIFGPSVSVGIVKVGYWDDITPGPGLKYLNVDPSVHDYSGYGPLFGYRFRAGNVRIVVSRKRSWKLADIQAMWAPFMAAVMEYNMQIEPSLERYLEMQRQVPQGPPPDRIFHPMGQRPF
jgi:hypothetical protein